MKEKLKKWRVAVAYCLERLVRGNEPINAEEVVEPSIKLTKQEVQSGMDRVRYAELLIKQLPDSHDGRNTWLLNYGEGGISDHRDSIPSQQQ